MFNARFLAPAGAGAGVVLAALVFLVFGGQAPSMKRLDDLEAAASSLPAQEIRPDDVSRLTAKIIAAPIFTLTVGPGSVAEVAIGLTGVAIGPNQHAALVSIGGGPAQWIQLGASRDGVTLAEVHADKIVVDTPTGFRDVRLWDQPPPSAGAPATGAPPSAGLTAPAIPPLPLPETPGPTR